jgi:transcriptional regulator of arginine metabolism
MPYGNNSNSNVLPNITSTINVNSNNIKQSLEGFLSIEFSENLGIIKTIPAFSHTIASAIDLCDLQAIAGTVAGNDTIIFAIRKGYSPQQVKDALLKEFPILIDKLL